MNGQTRSTFRIGPSALDGRKLERAHSGALPRIFAAHIQLEPKSLPNLGSLAFPYERISRVAKNEAVSGWVAAASGAKKLRKGDA